MGINGRTNGRCVFVDLEGLIFGYGSSRFEDTVNQLHENTKKYICRF